MKNLAGNVHCNEEIRRELSLAGVNIVSVKKVRSEVPYSLIGQLGTFNFTRAWYYWVVYGDVPLEVANELYASEIGEKEIRVAGHAGCPSPKEWTVAKGEKEVVQSYHIDSQEGLNLFVNTIKKHNLV